MIQTLRPSATGVPFLLEEYESTLIALWFILFTVMFQFVVAVLAHRMQRNYRVGIIDPSLTQESFFFRAHRTFWNSLENIIPFMGLAFLALIAGYDARKLSVITWVYAITRVFYTITYYMVATEKNPSVRSIFYLIGFCTTLFMMIDLGWFLITSA